MTERRLPRPFRNMSTALAVQRAVVCAVFVCAVVCTAARRLLLSGVIAIVVAQWITTPLAHAEDAPPPQVQVRAHLEPPGPVVAGTQIKLVVDVLTTTWFTDAPDWPLFDMPGALVTLPDEQAQNLTQSIDGQTWFGVRRAYRIAPQAGRKFDVPSFEIHVSPAGASAPVTLHTPAQTFVATVPPGAQGMAVFFPTRDLQVMQKVERGGTPLRVGDTVTRSVTQRAAETQSMLIPPVSFDAVEDTRQYPREPQTHDVLDGSHGLVAGERTDAVMYVVDQAGSIELPPLRIEWWNTATQQREVATLPAVRLHASAARDAPLFDLPQAAGKAVHRIVTLDARDGLAIAVAGLVVIALAMSWRTVRARVRREAGRLRAAQQHWQTGEPHAWRTLCRASRRDTWPETVAALYRWAGLARRETDADVLCELSEDEDVRALAATVAAHYRAREAGAATPAQAEIDRARHTVRTLRRKWRTARAMRRNDSDTALPPLYGE